MKIIGIIPARYGSTRFPGKPLAMLGEKTMIQRVYEQACRADCLAEVIVATDDERIAAAVRGFGGTVAMTSTDCANGTERCAEVLASLPAELAQSIDIVVNIQGDEPFIHPEQIAQLADILVQGERFDIATLVRKISNSELLFNPNCVKAVVAESKNTNGNQSENKYGSALYFSRQPLPFVRGADASDWLQHADFYQHIGLYAYRAAHLARLAALSPTALERAESLEQLRWLEHGFAIGTAVTAHETVGIDTPEDLIAALKFLK